MAPKAKDQAVRFWDKTNIGKPDECWTWRGRCSAKGYGEFATSRSEKRRAHRVVWELTHGPIPSGMHVLHRCDNPPCVNPAHLFLGDNLANIADKVGKGRQRGGRPPGAGFRAVHAAIAAIEAAHGRGAPYCPKRRGRLTALRMVRRGHLEQMGSTEDGKPIFRLTNTGREAGGHIDSCTHVPDVS